MSISINGCTVVTAGLTYRSDVLIEGVRTAEISPNLSGDETFDAGGLVMPGGIDPHAHLVMPFMGT